MSIFTGLSMILGMMFGHGVAMLFKIEKERREDIRRYGEDLMPGGRLAYWIATPLSLAGAIACMVAT